MIEILNIDSLGNLGDKQIISYILDNYKNLLQDNYFCQYGNIVVLESHQEIFLLNGSNFVIRNLLENIEVVFQNSELLDICVILNNDFMVSIIIPISLFYRLDKFIQDKIIYYKG